MVAVFVARALMWPFFGLFGFFGHVLFVPIPWILIAIVAFVCWRYVTGAAPALMTERPECPRGGGHSGIGAVCHDLYPEPGQGGR